MSEKANVKEHHCIVKRSPKYLAIVGVGIPAISRPMVVCRLFLWNAGEERRDVDSLTDYTVLVIEVEGLVLEQVDGHLGSILGIFHVIRALVHGFVDATIACIVQLDERKMIYIEKYF